MEEKYCGIQGDQDICECVIKLVLSDIEMRFSQEELMELKNDKAKDVLRSS